MPRINAPQSYKVATLRLMADDVTNVGKQMERQLEMAKDLGVTELLVRYGDTVNEALKRINTFSDEIKLALRVAVESRDNEKMLSEGDEQAAAAAARLKAKAKSKKADPTINPKTGRPFAK